MEEEEERREDEEGKRGERAHEKEEVLGEEMGIQMNLLHPTEGLSGLSLLCVYV